MKPEEGKKIDTRSPEMYIRTRYTAQLAGIRLIETLAAAFALYWVFASPRAAQRIVEDFYSGVASAASSKSDLYSLYRALYDSVQFILAFELVLVIADGIAVFCLWTFRKGAGVSAFIHLVRFVSTLLGFLAAAFAIFRYIAAVVNAARAMHWHTFADIFTFIGSYGLLLYIVFIAGAFGIFLLYDFRVFRTMRQVAREIRTGEILRIDVKKKGKPGTAALRLACVFGASAVFSAVKLLGGGDILAHIAAIVSPVEILYVGANWISAAAVAVLAVKYYLAWCCATYFDSLH